MLDALWIDLRHSVRRLRRSPVLSAVVIGTVALIIGANTTIFTFLKIAVIDSPPVPAPSELVAISFADPKSNRVGYAYAETFAAFGRDQSSFVELSLYNGTGVLRIETDRVPAIEVGLEAVSPSYVDLLHIQMSAGRFFVESDDDTMLAVISDRVARRIFGSPQAAVGESISTNGHRLTVVGVTAPTFIGLQVDAGCDIWLPIRILPTVNGNTTPVRAPTVIARLRPGVSFQQGRGEVLGRWPGVQTATIGALPPALRSAAESQSVNVESIWNGFSGLRFLYGRSLQAVMSLGVVLLALGCVNLGGLMLARGLMRQYEVAVQLAVGASRARVIGQSMIDGVLFAMCGLAVAVPLAWWAGLTVETMMTARSLPLRRHLTPDTTVLITATVASLLTGMAIGALPARRVIAVGAGDVLRRARTSGGLGRSGRAALVTQVALSMILVVAAGLFAGTLASLYANDPQTRPKPIVWTRLARNSFERNKTIAPSYFQELAQQAAAVPGADAAAYSILYPAGIGFPSALAQDKFADTRAPQDAVMATGLSEIVSPGFFDMFGIALLRGRDFAWSDSTDRAPVAIVNRALADALFPSDEAVGQRIRMTLPTGVTSAEIVGVVANYPIGRLQEPNAPVLFRPLTQEVARAQVPNLHVSVNGDIATVRDGYTRVVSASRYHFVRALFTIDHWVIDALLQQRLVAGISMAAAVLAVSLAGIGIFALLAFSVAARVREIGIRMSIGTTQLAVVRMIVREAVLVIVSGVIIGVPLALAVARMTQSLLYGVSPTDTRMLAGAALVFVAAGGAASFVPALRASRIQPSEALRQE